MNEGENQESRFPLNGVPLVPDGKELQYSKGEDDNIEYLHGPEISAGPLGKVHLQLDRYVGESGGDDDREVYAFADNKVTTMSRVDAEKNGFSVVVQTEESVIPDGFTFKCNLWSEENDFLASSVATHDPEEGAADLYFHTWSVDGGDAQQLVVPGTPEFAQSLKFNMETLQLPPIQGGEAQS